MQLVSSRHLLILHGSLVMYFFLAFIIVFCLSFYLCTVIICCFCTVAYVLLCFSTLQGNSVRQLTLFTTMFLHCHLPKLTSVLCQQVSYSALPLDTSGFQFANNYRLLHCFVDNYVNKFHILHCFWISVC